MRITFMFFGVLLCCTDNYNSKVHEKMKVANVNALNINVTNALLW